MLKINRMRKLPLERRIGQKKESVHKEPDDKRDLMPSILYRHVRLCERKVRDDVYEALAILSGVGLSLLVSVKAVQCSGHLHRKRQPLPSGPLPILPIGGEATEGIMM